MKNLFSILLLYLCLSPSAFSGPTDPNIRWRELHSQHFKVIYEETQKSLADVYLAAGEWAYSQLIPVFGESPNLPITVVLADQTDFANGAATFLPYQTQPLLMWQ